jgi:hypothetical protein
MNRSHVQDCLTHIRVNTVFNGGVTYWDNVVSVIRLMQAISFHSTLEHTALCETTPLDSCFLPSPSPISKSFPLFQLPLLIILLQPPLGLPLLHCPWEFQLETSVFMEGEFFLSLCPAHFHFCSLTWIAVDFSCAHLHIT